MRSAAARSTTAGRARRGLIGLATVAGFAVVAPAPAHADPAGCTRLPNGSGDNIVCTAGIPTGQTLSGTAGNDTITITGGPVNGGVLAVAGDDTISVTGTAGTVGSAAVSVRPAPAPARPVSPARPTVPVGSVESEYLAARVVPAALVVPGDR